MIGDCTVDTKDTLRFCVVAVGKLKTARICHFAEELIDAAGTDQYRVSYSKSLK